jgi:hypothetical protein
MDVWVLCIVMRDCDLFKFCFEIVGHLSNHVARQSLQINPVAELWGQYYLPELPSRVAGPRPIASVRVRRRR